MPWIVLKVLNEYNLLISSMWENKIVVSYYRSHVTQRIFSLEERSSAPLRIDRAWARYSTVLARIARWSASAQKFLRTTSIMRRRILRRIRFKWSLYASICARPSSPSCMAAATAVFSRSLNIDSSPRSAAIKPCWYPFSERISWPHWARTRFAASRSCGRVSISWASVHKFFRSWCMTRVSCFSNIAKPLLSGTYCSKEPVRKTPSSRAGSSRLNSGFDVSGLSIKLIGFVRRLLLFVESPHWCNMGPTIIIDDSS